MKNLVNNVGVVGSDVSGVGTVRSAQGGAAYGGDKAIMAFGYSGGNINLSNLINNVGVIAADVSGVGTARYYLTAAGYSTSA